MGGRIWARRPPEGGSEVGFTLRALEADPADSGMSPVEDVRPVVIPLPDVHSPSEDGAAPSPPAPSPAGLRKGQTPAG